MMGKRRIHSRHIGMVMTGLLGVVLFAATAVFILLLPTALFEALVVRSGLPALLPAATPPLGDTARLAAAYGVGGVMGAVGAILFRLLDRKFPAHSRPHARAFHFSDDPESFGIEDPVDGDYGALLERNLLPHLASGSYGDHQQVHEPDSGNGRGEEDEDPIVDGSGVADARPIMATVEAPVLPGFRRRADDSPREGRDTAYRSAELPVEEPMFIDLDLLRRGESASSRPATPADELDLGQWPDPASLIDAEIEFAEFEHVDFEVETPEPTPGRVHHDQGAPDHPEPDMRGSAKAPLFVMEPVSIRADADDATTGHQEPAEAASISALMERLEAGLAARSCRTAPPDAAPRDAAPVNAALDELRRMARGR